MIMCVIVPAVVFTVVAGGAMFVYAALHQAWGGMTLVDFSELALVLGIAVVLGFLLARWSRRAPRAEAAEVIAMPRPDLPEPTRPAPRLGKTREAA